MEKNIDKTRKFNSIVINQQTFSNINVKRYFPHAFVYSLTTETHIELYFRDDEINQYDVKDIPKTEAGGTGET